MILAQTSQIRIVLTRPIAQVATGPGPQATQLNGALQTPNAAARLGWNHTPGVILVQILQTRTVPTLPIAQAAAGLGLKMTQLNGIRQTRNAAARLPQLPKSHTTGVILARMSQTRTVLWNPDALAATGPGPQVTQLNGAQPMQNAAARVPRLILVH